MVVVGGMWWLNGGDSGTCIIQFVGSYAAVRCLYVHINIYIRSKLFVAEAKILSHRHEICFWQLVNIGHILPRLMNE